MAVSISFKIINKHCLNLIRKACVMVAVIRPKTQWIMLEEPSGPKKYTKYISHHLHVRWVPNQEILSELQCQDRIHTDAWCICCSQCCKRSSWSGLCMSSPSPLHWLATQHFHERYKCKQGSRFEPVRTHHLGLKAQNFEKPIFTFGCFSLKAVYNSCKLQRLFDYEKFLIMCSFTHTNITVFLLKHLPTEIVIFIDVCYQMNCFSGNFFTCRGLFC